MTEKKINIDVSRIYNGEVKEIPFSFGIVPEGTEDMDLAFENEARVTGKAYEKAHGKGKAESYVELTFTIDAESGTHCARCAKDMTIALHMEHTYGVTKKLEGDSDEFIEAPQGQIDVYELAETAFYLELPTKVLCKEDCKGLCPLCGHDLNEGECGCDRSFGTNHLEGLKKLLDK